MTTPNLPAAGTDFGPYFIPSNLPNGVTGGLGEFASWTREDWEALLAGEWADKLSPLGGPLAAVRELSNAIAAALTGDFDPFIDIVGQVPILGDAAEILGDLLAAFKGEYSGSDPILLQIQTVIGGLGGAIGAVLGGAAGLVNLGQLTTAPVNLLPGGGRFETADTVAEAEGWTWIPTGYGGLPGSALFTGDGLTEGLLLSPAPAEVEGGKKYTGKVRVKAPSATGAVKASPVIRWYDVAQAPISTTALPNLTVAAADWTELVGTDLVAPAGARYAHVALQVPGDVVGEVGFDEAGIYAAEQTLPQAIIAGLTDALNQLGDDIEDAIEWVSALVDRILDSLGVPKMGSLMDRIFDVGDILSEIQDAGEDAHAWLSDLTNDLLNNPTAVLGQIPQSLVTGLSTALSTIIGELGLKAAAEDLEDLLDRLFDGLTGGTGAVGKTIADVLDELRGLFDGSGLKLGKVPALPASKITSGTFGTGLIPNLDAGKITSGTFGLPRIPLLDQTKIPLLDASKIPTLDPSKVLNLPGLFSTSNTHTAQIADLQDVTQELQGVIGYGSCYMATSPGVRTDPTLMPFDSPLGPMVGVTLSGGKYVLGSKGLWDVSAQVRFWGAKFAPPKCFMGIVVRNSGGTIISRRKAMASSDDEITVTNVGRVVVPTAGCTIEIHAWTSKLLLGGNWRGIGGGIETTSFSVLKVSEETS